MSCPHVPDLHRWLDGELDDVAERLLDTHLSSCAECQAELGSLLPLLDAEEQLRATAPVLGRPVNRVAIAVLAAAALLAVALPFVPRVDTVPVTDQSTTWVLGQPSDPSRATPERPRRHHYRSSGMAPPPMGRWQQEAVVKARQGDCTESLRAVDRGMEVSVDHAVLYRTSWLCFSEHHSRPLEASTAETWLHFQPLLVHFEGEDRSPAAAGVPAWSVPATDGIEARLMAFIDNPVFRDHAIELFGPERIADRLGMDLAIEGLAAAGLSRVPEAERTPALEQAWARRVYVLATALRTAPGRLVHEHWRSLYTHLHEQLDDATTGAPPVVQRARRVGDGNEPLPEQAPPKRATALDIDELLQEQEPPPSPVIYGQDSGR